MRTAKALTRPAAPVAAARPSLARSGAGRDTGGAASAAFDFASLSVNGVPLRRKLAVGSASDAAEGEADRAAERVMRMPAAGPVLQRACAACEKEDEKVHRKETGAGPSEAPDIVHDVVSSGGSPLDAATRAFMEPRFGHDFSRVRVHTDARAAQSASAVNARAYTVGNDIVFGGGAFAPHSQSGRSLLAHELAHTLQQGGGAPLRRKSQWDAATEQCAAEPKDKWIKTVVVDQNKSQTATVTWSNGDTNSYPCSTGKGHCCNDEGKSVPACEGVGSRITGTNCTPITSGPGVTVKNRVYDHGGVYYWTEFEPDRFIALHKYAPVDGTPLSHGCVRLNQDAAVTIFCGSRQNATVVKVVNPARPDCSNKNLQQAWLGDFTTASSPDDGPDRNDVLQERKDLESAFGKKRKPDEYKTLTEKDIPRCVQRTVEEDRLKTPNAPGGKTGTDMMTGTPEEKIANDFATAYGATATAADALTLVKQKGHDLWQTAKADVQGNKDVKNDRPLYWARLKMSQTIRTAKPKWATSAAIVQAHIDALEQASRGIDSVSFAGVADGVKKILITGFDPFSLGGEMRRSNPSGAAVLDLDGQTISSGSGAAARSGFVKGAILPVRFEDFDRGMVENLVGPQVSGANHVDMVMTISQGSSSFELERYAGRARSEGTDNLDKTFGSHKKPDAGQGLKSNDEFIETTTTKAQRDAMEGPKGQVVSANGHTFSVYTDDMVKAEKNGSETPMTGAQAIKEKDPAITGSGGGFLSNEVFYRAVSTVKASPNKNIPMIHLHVPALDNDVSDKDFESWRTGIVQAVRQILSRVLSQLP